MCSFIRSSQLLASMVLLGCSRRSPEPAPGPEGSSVVQVENQGFSDMVIYAVGGSGQRIRLGLVTGNSTQSFTIPSTLVRGTGPIRFLADPIGANRAPVSDEIMVQPGDTVGLTLPPF